MSDSVFYCYGIPVAVQRSDGIMRRIELTPEDRAHIEDRLEIPAVPITFSEPEHVPEIVIYSPPLVTPTRALMSVPAI